MNEKIHRLKTSKDAYGLATNAERLGKVELAAAARQRGLQLRAAEEGFHSPAEQEIAYALFAFEEQKALLNGRKTPAGYTRRMIRDYGAINTAERLVMKSKASSGYVVLEEAGLRRLSFESIIDRFPGEFSEEAVKAARARLAGESYTPPKPSRGRGQGKVSAFDALDEVLVRAQRLALQRFDGARSEVKAWSRKGGQVLEGVTKKSGIALGNPGTPHPAKRARNVSMRFGDRMALLEWMQPSVDSQAMLYVITEGGSEPALPVDGLPYQTSVAYVSGRLRVVGIYGLNDADEAIEHYLDVLSDFAPPRSSADAEVEEEEQVLSADDYRLAIVDAELEDKDRRWLIAHYYEPNATASMEKLAERLGYETHKAGNSQYGAVAGRVAAAMRLESEVLADGPYTQNMQWLATLAGRNEEGHAQWRMRDALAAALQAMHWVDATRDDEEAEADRPTPEEAEEARRYGLSDTEVRQMMLSRKGQGRFRRDVLRFWGNACAVTGLQVLEFLIASHIKPWKASDPNERLDGFNGLALAPNLDRAFDKGLVTFREDGRIWISPALPRAARDALGIHDKMELRFHDSRLERYLAFHRQYLFKREIADDIDAEHVL